MLTKRQLLVLKEIIRLFTESGQPVGSKTLMQELPVHVSSATITTTWQRWKMPV